jgi:hypothetical protein
MIVTGCAPPRSRCRRLYPETARRYDRAIARREVPRRFRVSFETWAKKSAAYTACTWQDELKAVALAAMHHAVAHPRTPILSVKVEPLEDAPGAGLRDVATGELVDYNEWR